MAAEFLAPVLALGFGGFLMLAVLFGIVEMLGKVYGTFHSLAREDLAAEQRMIYLLLIWFVPFGWAIYLVLGKDRTSKLLSEVEIF